MENTEGPREIKGDLIKLVLWKVRPVNVTTLISIHHPNFLPPNVTSEISRVVNRSHVYDIKGNKEHPHSLNK